MLKQRMLAFSLITIMLLMPFTTTKDAFANSELENVSISESGTLNGWPDVPTWRIGDKYTYETQFDVQQLIQQANVSASLNTLTGDTVYEVTDIFFINVNNVQTLAYKMEIEGEFTSGNSGANLEGVSGRLDIGYTGEDIVRVRDLAVINSEFTLDVRFVPFNFGFLTQDIAEISFDTSYNPPKEKYDFPVRTGDQWYMEFFSSTSVSGTSDYFDPSTFDTAGPENNSWQVTANGVPTEDGKNIQYGGCDDSYKINEWNVTGVSQGFNWYCPDVRYNSWMRISNAAGFTIDWLLKRYEPADSTGVSATSNPGSRLVEIDIDLERVAVPQDFEQTIAIDYSSVSGAVANTNLQLRYEMTSTYLNPTTDANGQATELVNSSTVVDTTNASDDFSSNGLIVWDPQEEIIGAATIVIDLSLTPVDLVAQSEAIIVTRVRDGVSSILTKSIGYNALPGDLLSFSIPTQNRGFVASPSTTIDVTTPSGTTITETLPVIPPFGEARVDVDWTVPADEPIGTQTLNIVVDPDDLVTEDNNKTNNIASVEVFIGRTPTAQITVVDEVFTFENVTLDASASFDEDGGDVNCRFSVEKRPGLVENFDTENCIINYNWSDGADWEVTVIVTDDELDTDTIVVTATVFNRAPYLNLSVQESTPVGLMVTADATDSGDIDTISPSGQQVTITWPGLNCEEGTTQPTCKFLAFEEGPMTITAVATDDDGAQTTVQTVLNVLNVAPTIDDPQLFIGQNLDVDEYGHWNLEEDQVANLRVSANDTALDKDTLFIEWNPSDRDENWTITSVGPSSIQPVSWSESGLHVISVYAMDNDLEKSATKTATVNIINRVPTIEPIDDVGIFEDKNLSLTAIVDDTASDIDQLVVCWDLNSLLDADGDGVLDNDCDETGETLTKSWPRKGVYRLTATVIDDDGDFASTTFNVSIANGDPIARITNFTDVLALNEGDNLTLSGLDSSDTESDYPDLIYAWDSSHFDSDLDGDTTGEVDYYGAEYFIAKLPPGEHTITLTVTDDDGVSKTTTIDIKVKAKPAEGFFESITDSVGGVGTIVIGVLFVVVIALAAFLLFTRNSSNEEDKYATFNLPSGTAPSQFNEPIPNQTTSFDLYGQPPAADPYAAYNPNPQPAADPYAAYNPTPEPTADPYAAYNPTPQPVAEPYNPVPQPAVNNGPPLPATGLPAGWTMEQWQHYGEQYLAAQSGQTIASQPTITDTTTQSPSRSLNDILDDIDF